MPCLKGISLNVNGLLADTKWRAIFAKVRKADYDFVLLQETHATPEKEALWQAEWGGNIYFSNGRSNARGVMTMFPRNSDILVAESHSDLEGRLLILQIEKDSCKYTLGNVYAPTQDHTQDQIDLVDSLEEQVSISDPHNIIIGGDFNLCMNASLDKSTSASSSAAAEGA